MQKEGDEPFDIAAIHRTGFLLGFCIWVLPLLVEQVKGVVGVRTSIAFQNLIDPLLQHLLLAAFWGNGITSRAE